jgi:hypothetical protein
MIQLTMSGVLDTVLQKITDVLADKKQTTPTLRRNPANELTRLDVQEERLLDLATVGTLPRPRSGCASLSSPKTAHASPTSWAR